MNNDTRPHESWGTFNFITNEAGFGDLQSDTMTYESLYIAAAKQHPNVQFAEYDAAQDSVQKRFLALSGQSDVDLLEAIRQIRRTFVPRRVTLKVSSPAARPIRCWHDHSFIPTPPTASAYVIGSQPWRTISPLTMSAAWIVTRTVISVGRCPDHLRPYGKAGKTQNSNTFSPFRFLTMSTMSASIGLPPILSIPATGLVLIDSLYGKWINVLERNIRQLGFDPADIKYLINTHGHFDHAGGSAHFQKHYGTKVVMTEQDWQIALAEPDSPLFYISTPRRDIVAQDGDEISLGDNTFTLYNTPGHQPAC